MFSKYPNLLIFFGNLIMKQINFVLECVVSDDSTTLIIRDSRTGQILKICNNMEDVASFLSETLTSFKNFNPSQAS